MPILPGTGPGTLACQGGRKPRRLIPRHWCWRSKSSPGFSRMRTPMCQVSAIRRRRPQRQHPPARARVPGPAPQAQQRSSCRPSLQSRGYHRRHPLGSALLSGLPCRQEGGSSLWSGSPCGRAWCRRLSMGLPYGRAWCRRLWVGLPCGRAWCRRLWVGLPCGRAWCRRLSIGLPCGRAWCRRLWVGLPCGRAWCRRLWVGLPCGRAWCRRLWVGLPCGRAWCRRLWVGLPCGRAWCRPPPAGFPESSAPCSRHRILQQPPAQSHLIPISAVWSRLTPALPAVPRRARDQPMRSSAQRRPCTLGPGRHCVSDTMVSRQALRAARIVKPLQIAQQ